MDDIRHKLPISHAARAVGLPVTSKTIARWIVAGRITGAVRVGSRWFVNPQDLLAAFVAESIAEDPGARLYGKAKERPNA